MRFRRRAGCNEKKGSTLKEKSMEAIGYRVLMITLALFLLFNGSPLRAQPDKIVLEGKTRPAVTFPHNRHVEAGLSCKDCHHIYENGKNVLDEGELEEGNQKIHCSACHGQNASPGPKQAFHDQCIGCHRKVLKKGEKTGPLYCGECHIRK
jgi:hypothetical protein